MPGQPGYAYGPGGYGYGQQQTGPGVPPPPKKSNVGKILLIVGAGVVALILIGVVAVGIFAARSPQAGPNTPPDRSSGPTAAPPVSANPSDAVDSYLQALASGDADAALALTADVPAQRPLLTSAVLAQSRKLGGVSQISVAPVSDQSATSIPATYRVGKVQVNEAFQVAKVGGQWKLNRTYEQPDLASVIGSSYPVLVNNTRVSGLRAYAFPGTYAITTGSPFVSYSAKTIVVEGPSRDATVPRVSPRITTTGSKRMVAAAKSSLNACLKQRKLAPKGCPFAATATGYKVTQSSVRWNLVGNPFKKAKAGLTAGLFATTTVNITVKGSVACTSPTFTGTCTVTINRRATASSVLSAKSMKVFWTTKRR